MAIAESLEVDRECTHDLGLVVDDQDARTINRLELVNARFGMPDSATAEFDLVQVPIRQGDLAPAERLLGASSSG